MQIAFAGTLVTVFGVLSQSWCKENTAFCKIRTGGADSRSEARSLPIINPPNRFSVWASYFGHSPSRTPLRPRHAVFSPISFTILRRDSSSTHISCGVQHPCLHSTRHRRTTSPHHPTRKFRNTPRKKRGISNTLASITSVLLVTRARHL